LLAVLAIAASLGIYLTRGSWRSEPAAAEPTRASRPELTSTKSARAKQAPTLASQDAASPPPYEIVETGIAECDAFIQRYMRCPAIPDRTKVAMVQQFRDWQREAAADDPQVTTDLGKVCGQTMRAQDESLAAMGC